jgi:hypothetical protein
MYVGAGGCPFPGQLQYRVVNPRGAGVFFEKNFATPVGTALRPGAIVCGTPRSDPSGMSSYVIEVANGFANALDFEQLTSAAPNPVLASGEWDEFVGAACGPNLYWDEASQTCLPLALPQVPTAPTPQCPPGSFYDYFKQTCVSSKPVTRGDYYVGDDEGGPTIIPILPCPKGQFWDASKNHCVSIIPPPPPLGSLPPITPITSGMYVGDGGPIVPVLPCPSGQFWDVSQNHCAPVIPPPPPVRMPATLSDWEAQHRAGWGGRWPERRERADWPREYGRGRWPSEHEGRGHWGQLWDEFVGATGATSPGETASQHAANAAAQALAAQKAAAHPEANTSGRRAAQQSLSHAAQAASHARVAQQHPTARGSVMHARAAMAHNVAAAHHARAAHGEVRGRGREGFGFGRGRGREGFGFGFGREGFGGRGRGWGWERGGRYEGWLGGVGALWLHHRARCIARNQLGVCLKELITWPEGQVSYRLTPQGEQEQVVLEVDEQSQNDQVAQQLGTQVPDASSGPMPGSEQQGQAGGDGDGKGGDHDGKGGDHDGADQASADANQTSADAGQSDAEDGSDSSAAVTGEFAGWQFPFTTSYPGFWNPYMPAAWDSSFNYPGFDGCSFW